MLVAFPLLTLALISSGYLKDPLVVDNYRPSSLSAEAYILGNYALDATQ